MGQGQFRLGPVQQRLVECQPEASYFFWLGNKAMWISYNIPTYIDSGATLASEMSNTKHGGSAKQECVREIYKKLGPDVANNVKLIAI
jgi:hypothetical protein